MESINNSTYRKGNVPVTYVAYGIRLITIMQYPGVFIIIIQYNNFKRITLSVRIPDMYLGMASTVVVVYYNLTRRIEERCARSIIYRCT